MTISFRTQSLAVQALRFGTAVNVALEVGQLQFADREPLPEGREQVLEVQINSLNGALFRGLPVRLPVAVTEGRDAESLRFGGEALPVGVWLAVEFQELDEIAAGRQFDQPLLKPHHQGIGLGGFGIGLNFGQLAQRQGVLS